MPWAYVAHRGSFNEKVSAATVSVNPTAEIPERAILVVRCADESGALSNHLSCTDTKGNDYALLRQFRNANLVNCSLWISKLRYTLYPADIVTVRLASAAAAKVIGLEQFSIAYDKTYERAGTASASGTGTLASATVLLDSEEYLFLGMVGVEGPNEDAFTQDPTFSNNTSIGTTGDTPDSNCSSRFGSKVETAAGSSYDTTITSRPWAAGLVALREINDYLPQEASSPAFGTTVIRRGGGMVGY